MTLGRYTKRLTAHGVLQRFRVLAPKSPGAGLPAHELDFLMGEVLTDLRTVATDKNIRICKRDADLALRFMLTDETGMTEFVTPSLLKIVRRYVRSDGGALR
ncbi:MAG: hypothetical protein JSR89_18205 [Proteobacteria bacterium]|nr:hypothetical protein [Pseudomonadota bacterium]